LPSEGAGTREHILRAAKEVIADRGIANATTRAIAERAGCAEGSIYRHFSGKQALMLEVVKGRFPDFFRLVTSSPERVGVGTVKRNLEEIAVAAMGLFRGVIPLLVGAMTERDLLLAQRQFFLETNTGPLRMHGALVTYLEGERRLGRIASRASPKYVARLLMGGCFGHAFLLELMGDHAAIGTEDRYAREIVRAVMEGITPQGDR
jgi:AcrR family transcriptional regulator